MQANCPGYLDQLPLPAACHGLCEYPTRPATRLAQFFIDPRLGQCSTSSRPSSSTISARSVYNGEASTLAIRPDRMNQHATLFSAKPSLSMAPDDQLTPYASAIWLNGNGRNPDRAVTGKGLASDQGAAQSSLARPVAADRVKVKNAPQALGSGSQFRHAPAAEIASGLESVHAAFNSSAVCSVNAASAALWPCACAQMYTGFAPASPSSGIAARRYQAQGRQPVMPKYL